MMDKEEKSCSLEREIIRSKNWFFKQDTDPMNIHQDIFSQGI